MKRTLILLTALAAALPAPAPAVPSDLVATKVADFSFATGMEFTRSGDRLFVNERAGRIRVFVDGALKPEPVATIPTSDAAEDGLLGLALHPQFEAGSPFLYVFATVPGGGRDRVIRMRIESDKATQTTEIMKNLPGEGYHHGGILAFGRDGKLYVSHGESHDTDRAQRPGVLGGKIYRLNDDGSIPSDNPFEGKPTFAYGIRNPFGLCLDPQSGLLWETENGPENFDEINIIERGKNYGWPVVRGKSKDRRFVNPVQDYERVIVPTMCAFGGDALPEPYRGSMFFGAFASESVRQLKITADRRGVERESTLHEAGAGVVGMTMGPDGLYYSTPEALFRIATRTQPTPSPPAPESPTQTAGPTERSGGRGPLFALVAAIALGLALSLTLLRRR